MQVGSRDSSKLVCWIGLVLHPTHHVRKLAHSGLVTKQQGTGLNSLVSLEDHATQLLSC